MQPNKQIVNDIKMQRELGLLSSRTAIAVALVAAATAIFTLIFNYWMIERIRHDISAQTLALERIKVDIASSAQKTSETVAKIDSARLVLERQIALTTEHFESRKVNIEDKKSRTDEVRLTQDFAKLSNDLRPHIKTSCYGKYLQPDLIRMECTFENNGVHRVKIVPTSTAMHDSKSLISINNAIIKNENSEENIIPSGFSGLNTIDIKLTPIGEKIKQPIIRFQYTATTDQQAINMTKRLSGGYITDAELKELSTQKYTFKLLIN